MFLTTTSCLPYSGSLPYPVILSVPDKKIAMSRGQQDMAM
jgi:hypothetical protein